MVIFPFELFYLDNKIMRSQFCISSTASFDKINKAATNRSITKQTFSFSKSNRFENPKPTCPNNTYGGDFMQRKPSGTGIGYGTRSDFTKCYSVSPASAKYNLKSFWDEGVAKKKGPKFALSRDQVAFNSYISKEQLAFPTSTQYNNDKPLKGAAPKYTLRQKTKVLDKSMTIEPQNRNPGPGSYLNPEMESKPSFKSISKFQNISYGQSRTRRFESSQTLAPGPGKYKDISSLPNNGKYLLSNNRGGTKAKFDSEQRQTYFDQVYRRQLSNPGPGYYQAPSEFGQYDGDIYNEMRKSKRATNGWTNLTERKSQK